MQRRRGGQGLRTIAPQLEIVAFGDGLQQCDALLVIDRHGSDKRYVDIRDRRFGQQVENGRLECKVIHFRVDTEGAK